MDQVADKPLWRRIFEFPLVAMVVAAALIIFASGLAQFIIGLFIGLTGEMHRMPTGLELRDMLMGPYLVPAAIAEIVASVLVYKLVVRHLGDRPHDDLPLERAAPDGGHGLAAGALIFSLIVGIAALMGVYHIDRGGDWSSFVSILVGMGIMPGFREELLFRGVLFRFIEDFGGSWAALVITSLLFGMAHYSNHGATLQSSLFIAVEAGVLLGAVYMLTRNLWMAMGLHAAWNFTQGFIWDVPVSGYDVDGLVTARLDGPALLSGGQFGLEASVIAFTCATLLGLFYLRLAIQRGRLVQPWWVRRRLVREQVVSVPTTAEA